MLGGSEKAAEVKQWERGELCSSVSDLCFCSHAHQHKSTYGLALDYPMDNIREVSALEGKKKAGVSAGMKSEVTVQQQMQKREEEDCILVRVNNYSCALPQAYPTNQFTLLAIVNFTNF